MQIILTLRQKSAKGVVLVRARKARTESKDLKGRVSKQRDS